MSRNSATTEVPPGAPTPLGTLLLAGNYLQMLSAGFLIATFQYFKNQAPNVLERFKKYFKTFYFRLVRSEVISVRKRAKKVWKMLQFFLQFTSSSHRNSV